MEWFNQNKKLLIISGSLILLTFLVVLFISDSDDMPHEFELEPNFFLRNYEINEVIHSFIDDQQMARIYLAEYKSLLINDPQRAYELLNEEYRSIKYPTYKDFEKYLDLVLNDRFYSSELVKYDIRPMRNFTVYDLIDSADNNFIFRVTSIMNYTVLLDRHTI